MFLLDTNIISELRRTRPHGAVTAWLRGVPENAIFLSAVTIGEIQVGIESARDGDASRARMLEQWLELVIATYKVLPLGSEIFREWARLKHGQPLSVLVDAMIGATAVVHELRVVSRNVSDFERLGLAVFNPFTMQ